MMQRGTSREIRLGLFLVLGAATQVSAQAAGGGQRQEIRWGAKDDKAYVEKQAVQEDPLSDLFVLSTGVGKLPKGSIFAPSQGRAGVLGPLMVAIEGQNHVVPPNSYFNSPANDDGKVKVFLAINMGKVYKSPTPTGQTETPIGMVQPGQRYVLVSGGGSQEQGQQQQQQQAQQAQQGQQTGQQGQQTGQQGSPTGQQGSPTGQQNGQQQDPISQLLQKLMGGNQQNQQGGNTTPAASTNQLTPAEQAQLDQAIAQSDRDKLASTGGADQPFGNEIRDTNGNVVGWDRDGDGQADLEDTNRDGVPDSYNGGTYKDAYLDPSVAANPDGETAADPTDPADPSANQGLNGVSALGQPFSAGGQTEEEKAEEERKKREEEGEVVPEEDDGKGGRKQLVTVRGRVVLISRKPDVAGAVVAAQAGWGDEWAEPTQETSAPRSPARTPLAEQLNRVEASIAAWRAESAMLTAEIGGQTADLYGDTPSPASTPRSPKQMIDARSFYVWIVSGDSWREGQSPVRLKLSLPEDDLVELADGAYVIVQGKMAILRADQRLIEELDGEVKGFELRRVILSSPEPPAFSPAPQAGEAIAPAGPMGPPAFGPGAGGFGPDDLPSEELQRLAEQLEAGQG